MNPGPRTVFFVAGEVSGDIQASAVIRELRRRDPALEIVGVGGPRMAAAGMTVLVDSSDWGVMGHIAPLLRAPEYQRSLREIAATVSRLRPQVLVLVDFPGFNLRLAATVGALLPVLYYFPPMVTVRKGDRARRVAALGMRLLATLPFEAEAYRAAGADVVFVGHPAVDTVRPRWDASIRRERLGLTEGARVVGLLPGSRNQEIAFHLPVMADAAAALARRYPGLEFVLPVAAAHLRPPVDEVLARSALPVRVTSDVYDAIAESEVLVTASGSVTLEAAVLAVPMVVVYRLSWLSWQIARALVSVRHASLPNLLAGREIIPELLQDKMTAANIAAQVERLLDSPARREAMQAALRAVCTGLGPPGAIGRAADEVFRMLGYNEIDSASRDS
ncbi:MAG: lipid-A-disaccharide synthase [bacterium]